MDNTTDKENNNEDVYVTLGEVLSEKIKNFVAWVENRINNVEMNTLKELLKQDVNIQCMYLKHWVETTLLPEYDKETGKCFMKDGKRNIAILEANMKVLLKQSPKIPESAHEDIINNLIEDEEFVDKTMRYFDLFCYLVVSCVKK